MKNRNYTGKILIKFLVILVIIVVIITEYLLIVRSVEETINNIEVPEIFVETEFEKLTEEGLEFSIIVNLFNPNDFELTINEFLLVAKTDENNKVGSLSIDGKTIKSKTSSTFSSKGVIFFEALNAKFLVISIDGEATVKVRDFDKTLSLVTEMKVSIPDIADFVFQNKAVDIEIPIQFKLKLKGILGIVGFKIFNPSEIPLVGKNLICRIYRLDDNTRTLLGEQEMDPCEISPKAEAYVNTEILIPYRKFFFSAGFKLLPNWIILQVKGDLSIAGTRQVIPITINGYVDPHFLRTLDKR